MAKFIILDSSEQNRNIYINIIKKFTYTSKEHYDISEHGKYNSETIGDINSERIDKIYVINSMFDERSGFSIARTIRTNGDLESQIIIVCDKDFKLNSNLIKNTLILGIIKCDYNFVNNFYDAIISAHKILMRHSALTFSSYDEIYRIPYDSIYMVEKNYKDDSVTIYTKDDSINRYATIKAAMEEMLNDFRFFKCSRSCIINLHKIVSYDCVNNIIYFDNGMTTNKISTREKTILKDRLKMYKIK